MCKKINIISTKADSFIKSKWSFFIFVSAILFFGIINLIFFVLIDGFEIISPWVENDISINNYSWLGYVEIFIATIGSSLTIAGVVMAIRLNRKYIYLSIPGEVLVIVDAIIIGALFTGLSYFIMIVISIYNWYTWEKESDNKVHKIRLSLFIISIYVVIGLLIIGLFNYNDAYKNINNYIDVIASGIVVGSWYLILNKKSVGFIGFVLTDVAYIMLFFSVGVWATGSSYIIYLLIDITSYVSWHSKKIVYNIYYE